MRDQITTVLKQAASVAARWGRGDALSTADVAMKALVTKGAALAELQAMEADGLVESYEGTGGQMWRLADD